MQSINMQSTQKEKEKNTQKEKEANIQHLTEQALSINDLLYGIKHQKIIFVLVYLHRLKGKPVVCKNQWRVYLYPDWVNAEIQSFDWFTFLRCRSITSEWN